MDRQAPFGNLKSLLIFMWWLLFLVFLNLFILTVIVLFSFWLSFRQMCRWMRWDSTFRRHLWSMFASCRRYRRERSLSVLSLWVHDPSSRWSFNLIYFTIVCFHVCLSTAFDMVSHATKQETFNEIHSKSCEAIVQQYPTCYKYTFIYLFICYTCTPFHEYCYNT